MVKAGDAFKAGCFGAMGVWFFLIAAPIIGLLVICGGLSFFRATVPEVQEREAKVNDGGAAEALRIEKAKQNFKAREDERKKADGADDPEEIIIVGPHGLGDDQKRPPEDVAAKKQADKLAAENKRADKEAKKRADDQRRANAKLVAAKSLMSTNPKAARKHLQEILDKWPDTRAADEARKLLK